jgi:integrase
MGVTVRQKVKGKGKPWWVFVAHNGQRTSKMIGSKDAANLVARQIEAKLALGEFSFEEEKPVKTFKEYADSWIKTTVPATCKESTVREYQDILKNHIESVFSSQKVTQITRGDIKTFLLGKLNDGYAKSTVMHMRNCLSGVFNMAVDDEIIQANPTYGLGKFLKPKDRKKDINPLTSEELKKLSDSVQVYFLEHYPMFILLARTGMRIGEAIALKWADIDFNGRFIEVTRSIVREKITTPKNDQSRSVDMSRQLTEVLIVHRTESKKKGLKLGLGELPEYVFTNQVGGRLYKDNWRRRVFNKALEKAEIRKIRIHDMRHTYATLRIAKGDNTFTI